MLQGISKKGGTRDNNDDIKENGEYKSQEKEKRE